MTAPTTPAALAGTRHRLRYRFRRTDGGADSCPDRIEQLVCIDPSEDMVRICERRLSPYQCDKRFPSARHYTIGEIRQWNRRFNRYKRVELAVRPKRALKRLPAAVGLIPRTENIVDKVNAFLLINRYITAPLAHIGEYLPGYEGVFATTYHHIKATSNSLGPFWRQVDDRLRRRYPDGGADITMVFRKAALLFTSGEPV